MSSFQQFLAERLAAGGFSTEDTLASFLPLAREVLETHAAGFVAPLEGLADLQLEGARIWFEQSKRRTPRHNEQAPFAKWRTFSEPASKSWSKRAA